MRKHRYTIETLASGQPRPYADTIRRHRITYEWQGMEGYKNIDAPFVLCENMHEQLVRRDCHHFSGWTERTDPAFGFHSTRLNYLKQVSLGVWEWETCEPFID